MTRKIIFDTDIGTDIDDAYALALILASPELELVGVTIADGRTDQRAQLALRMLYETGRDDVPVAVGRQTAGGGSVNQAAWGEGFAATEPVAQSAAEFIVEQVNAAPGEITLVPVGPFTNLAEALALDPQLPKKVAEIILMGGCVGWPEGATPEIYPEYNIKVDIPASQALFSCGAPLTVVPLDATRKVNLEADDQQRIAAVCTPLTEALVALLSLWVKATPCLHDPLAVGVVLDRTLCGLVEMRLEVDDEGHTPPAPGDPNCTVALTPQVGRFLSLFRERLLGQRLGRG